jgi:hypothetical protein
LRWLSLPALFFVIVLVLTRADVAAGVRKRFCQGALLVAALGTLVGLFRFVRQDAVPGIVSGGEQAVAKRAVSHLREILRVEDAVRRSGVIDPDGDRVGSAAFIGELSGSIPARHGHIERPPLNRRFQTTKDTPVGKAAFIDGYYFIVCLPTLKGGYAAVPGTDIDEERSEQSFLVYAWPEDPNRETYALDADERIWARSPTIPGRPTYFGQLHPPDCEAAAENPTKDGWVAWRGKKPRANRGNSH